MTHKIRELVDQLIAEGKAVLQTKYDASIPGVVHLAGAPVALDLQAFTKWKAGCANLLRLLGSTADTWREGFNGRDSKPSTVIRGLGTLEAIADAIDKGLLLKVEDFIRADSHESLLEQADYLLAENYFLAAGVLGRAVLEEHLRNLCKVKECFPSKAKPTANDYKESLYKAQHFNLVQMKHIESLIAVGNDAAHNKGTIVTDDVKRLLCDVRDVIERFPLASV